MKTKSPHTKERNIETIISTIQDIVDVITPENKERFKADMCDMIDEIAKVKSEHPDMYIASPSYIWIDDHRENRDITVTFIDIISPPKPKK